MQMRYGTIPGVEKPVSRLVQGTVMLSSEDLDKSLTLLDEVYELGCRTFDTAQSYGLGEAERVLGRWLHERGVQDEVVIISKGAHHNKDRQRVTPFDITADLHDSLARLKVERIDLYLLHRDNPEVPVGPIIDVLNEHQRAGKIGPFGASNWSIERIQEANDYAEANGLSKFVVSSPNFSLAEQVKEPWPNCISIGGPKGQVARDWYADQKMPLITWSSLAGGFFSGRFERDNRDQFDSTLDRLCIESYGSEDNFTRLDRVRELANEKGLTIPQIATAYVVSQPLDIYAIIGCQSGAEFASNLEALALDLTPEEVAWLDLRAESRGRDVEESSSRAAED